MRRSSNPQRRRGLTTVAVLICLLVLGLICGVLVKLGVAYRDRVRTEERRLQAEWLAEAGVDRALARLARDPEYAGESWEIPADALALATSQRPEKGPAAVVAIEVGRAEDQGGGWIVRARADYPPAPPRRVRASREVVVSKTP